MATAAELLAARASGTSATDNTLVIDNYLRMIQIPSSITNLGVENDDDVLRLKFRMPRYLGETDLSTFSVRINYLNAKGESDVYTVDDLEIVGSNLTFSWLVGPTATKYKGNTKFNVCMRIVDADFYVLKEYNTTIATLPVLEGLECEESVVEYYSDILEQWKAQLFGIGDTEEAKLLAKSQEEQENIANKGAEVLATIPENYTSTYHMAREAYRNKSDAIVCSVSGDYIHLDNSAEDPFRSLKIFGRTTQPQTTGAQIFDATNYEGVGSNSSITVSDDQYLIVATGGVSAGYAFSKFPVDVARCAGKTLVMKVDKLEGQSECGVMMYGFIGGASVINYTLKPGQTSVECPIAADVEEVKVYVYTNTTGTAKTANNTVTVKGLMVYEKDAANGSWEPYSGGLSSPSPEWPQSQTDVTDTTISILGANLFEYERITSTSKGGVTITNNGDGSFTIDGSSNTTEVCSAEYAISNAAMKGMFHPGNLRLITDVKTYPMIFVNLYRNGSFMSTILSSTWSRDYSYTLPEDFFTSDIYSLRIGFHANADTAIIPGTVTPILTQHSGDIQESLRGWSVIYCSDEYTLRGIPVSEGGNYTDSEGQQWICDEIDYAKGTHIQRIGVSTFTNAFEYVGASYTDGSGVFYCGLSGYDTSDFNLRMISTHFRFRGYATHNTAALAQLSAGEFSYIRNPTAGARLYFAVAGIETKEAATEWLASTAPVVFYPLKTPVETELDMTTINKAEWLTTYYPRTTLVNPNDTGMYVEYNADLKRYANEIMADAAEEVITQDKIQAAVDAWLAAHYSTAEGVSF